MTAQDIKYLLECIKKDNHAIVVAYLKHALGDSEQHFWKTLKRLVAKKPDMVISYLQHEDTLEYFAKENLPDPTAAIPAAKQIA